MKYIIFMDIDGTLTAQNGAVPKTAQKAIIQAREKGHQVILSTGRSLAEITNDILSIGFDGIIGAGGAYIEYQGTVLKHIKFKESQIKEIINFMDHHDIGYYLESNEGIFGSPNCTVKIKEASQRLLNDNPDLFINKADPTPWWFLDILKESENKKIPYNNINKMSFISTDYPFSAVKERFEKNYEVYEATVFEFGPQSGEIGLKGIDKKVAIEILLKEIKTNHKTFAYGDGLNDVAMFEAVDHAVAMKNGRSKLKQMADEITDIAEEDGIYNSFKKNKVI